MIGSKKGSELKLTGNNIGIIQNTKHGIDLQAAKSHLYSLAEKLQYLQMILPFMNAILWPPLLFFFPDFKVWATFCGFIIVFLDTLVFETLQKKWKLLAAKVQENFDCEVLHIAWNSFKVGVKPTEETVTEHADKYRLKGGDESVLKDWYTFDFDNLPISLARIICQRSNFWWDSKLRRSYSTLLLTTVIVLSIFSFAIGIASKITVDTFVLAIIAPLAPFYLWSIREMRRQQNTAEEGERLLQESENQWKLEIDGKQYKQDPESRARELQDEIFLRRKNAPVNPSWLYRRKRDQYQHLMIKGANELISEFRQLHSLSRKSKKQNI